jgi:hypothetical protein
MDASEHGWRLFRQDHSEMMADRLRAELIKIGDYPFRSRENHAAHKKRSTGIKRK